MIDYIILYSCVMTENNDHSDDYMENSKSNNHNTKTNNNDGENNRCI